MLTLMRQTLTYILLLAVSVCTGQSFKYPAISSKAHNFSEFIPHGWILLDSASGDLNKDNLNDIALVIQHRDSISITRARDGAVDTIVTQPRILILAFYNSNTRQYDLQLQNNSFVLNHDQANMEDPFQNISIASGVLKIEFTIFMNAGGWGMSNNAYIFRYRRNSFYLIGADYNYTHRGSGETEDRSYNFLTKKVRVVTGTISADKQKITWRSIKLNALKTFDTFLQPFTWQVEKDDYL
ncbi:MAG: hypothetical protein JWQ27_58 [Ferruginibacter sp.]|nr:hypothetical protein [Ferruginibacter sp.]